MDEKAFKYSSRIFFVKKREKKRGEKRRKTREKDGQGDFHTLTLFFFRKPLGNKAEPKKSF
jgi:hypothetical protein